MVRTGKRRVLTRMSRCLVFVVVRYMIASVSSPTTERRDDAFVSETDRTSEDCGFGRVMCDSDGEDRRKRFALIRMSAAFHVLIRECARTNNNSHALFAITERRFVLHATQSARLLRGYITQADIRGRLQGDGTSAAMYISVSTARRK